MDTTSLVLSGLLSAAIILWVGPSVLHMNKGKVLQNIAIWIGLFCALGLIYKTIGPSHNLQAPPTTQSEEAPLPATENNLLAPRNEY